MAKWIRKETGREWNPYYYMCELGSLKLSLSVPYRSDPWGLRLTKGSTTVYKEYFHLRAGDRENQETWESVEDLEKAQAEAFEIIKRLTMKSVDYWTAFMKKIEEMEAQGKEQDGGEEEPAEDQGINP